MDRHLKTGRNTHLQFRKKKKGSEKGDNLNFMGRSDIQCWERQLSIHLIVRPCRALSNVRNYYLSDDDSEFVFNGGSRTEVNRSSDEREDFIGYQLEKARAAELRWKR